MLHATTISFWTDALLIDRLEVPHLIRLIRRSFIFSTFAVLVWVLDRYTVLTLTLDFAPYQVGGAALSLLLVMRTNGGYERWWEARKLWGSVVNQSRNLATTALAYGPTDAHWRSEFVRWTIAYCHAMRRGLRAERVAPELERLLGREAADQIVAADHMALHVAGELARRLFAAVNNHGMDGFAFMQMDKDRSALLDHLGGCERILKTPMPWGYIVMLRHFLVVFLALLPFALIESVGWMTPLMTLFVAFPLLALDEIASELQNPFSTGNMDHLPLDEICATIERNLLALNESQAKPASS